MVHDLVFGNHGRIVSDRRNIRLFFGLENSAENFFGDESPFSSPATLAVILILYSVSYRKFVFGKNAKFCFFFVGFKIEIVERIDYEIYVKIAGWLVENKFEIGVDADM